MSNSTTKLDDFSLICYKAICSFIQDLNEVFGTKIHQVALYTRLIEKTSITQTKAIFRHITIFREFCQENRDAILEKDISKFSGKKITYSNKVYIDICKVFNVAKSDKDTEEAIWNHLLTISALLDPTSKAKSILKETSSKKGKEEEFLNKIIETAEKNIDPNADPADAVKGMLSSGMLTEMMGNLTEGMKSGELDITKLIGVSQSLMSSLTTEMAKEGVQPVGVDFSALSGLTNMLPALMSGFGSPDLQNPNETQLPPLTLKNE